MTPHETALRHQLAGIDQMISDLAHYKALIQGIGFNDLTLASFEAAIADRKAAILVMLEEYE